MLASFWLRTTFYTFGKRLHEMLHVALDFSSNENEMSNLQTTVCIWSTHNYGYYNIKSHLYHLDTSKIVGVIYCGMVILQLYQEIFSDQQKSRASTSYRFIRLCLFSRLVFIWHPNSGSVCWYDLTESSLLRIPLSWPFIDCDNLADKMFSL